jgi:hypothetical protein
LVSLPAFWSSVSQRSEFSVSLHVLLLKPGDRETCGFAVDKGQHGGPGGMGRGYVPLQCSAAFALGSVALRSPAV